MTEQVQKAVHHQPMEFLLCGEAQGGGDVLYAVIADQDIPAHTNTILSIEGDDIGVFVVVQIPAIVIQQGLIAEQDIVQFVHAVTVVPGHADEPSLEPRPIAKGVGNSLCLERDACHGWGHSLTGWRLKAIATVAPLSENSTLSASARIRKTPRPWGFSMFFGSVGSGRCS